MELEMLLGLKILGVVLGTYVLVIGFVKKINEWHYVNSLGEEKKRHLPPGDMGWPLFGNMLSFLKAFSSKDPDSFIRNLVQRYGRSGIYKTHLFGSPAIIVSIPETCRKVLTDEERFGIGYPKSTREISGKWIHSMSHAEHKHVRRLMKAPINGHEELAMYIGYIEEDVIKALDEWSSMNEPVEFMKMMEELTLKLITNIFFGPTIAKTVMGNLMVNNYADLMKGFNSVAINFPGFVFYKAFKARKVIIKVLQGVLDDKRRAKISTQSNDDPNQKRGMIDLLMEAEDENGHKFTDENIINLLLVFLLAGQESTALTITFAIIHMHEHPQVLLKAKEEQQQLLKKRPSTQKGLTMKDIREMNYLQKVIDETLRFDTHTFSLFREAKVDAKINGYFIPKGWKVLVWSRGVHMDSEVHSNPNKFIPERWENNKLKAPGSFLSFGGGNRICPGADLAKLETSIFLHYFLLNYKLERINPGAPITYLPTPRPGDNCLAKITKVQ